MQKWKSDNVVQQQEKNQYMYVLTIIDFPKHLYKQ